ncbi:MAG TPA: UbiD family decarboxylase, partial [Saprospiraceae bacterium]|nr:UbiD family decarboxylase [Saprospiraceae bacterium]
MTYLSLAACCADLERHNMLIRIQEELDPELVIPELQRRVYAAQGPSLFFERVKGSPFPAVSNVFGTVERSEFLFREVLKKLEWLLRIKSDPAQFFKPLGTSLSRLPLLLSALPKKKRRNQLTNQCSLSALPQLKCWPMDGGAFITLPQVISFPPGSLDPFKANVGMYRIQISGNDFETDREAGFHYQLHRGIGIHHRQHLDARKEFPVSIGVGGPPAYTLASIFPLPESLSEILFSGILNQRRYPYAIQGGHFIPQDVDFCITGTINLEQLKDEGPFGDHLGYYSLTHPFPFLENIKVYHKKDPIWHFTVVGRPPQEDSSFGHLIHQMVASATAAEFPGIKQVHAVDAAGVHPLLLAVGSERYMPFRDRKPEEILTQANLLLGKGQTSLAKYLIIAAEEDSHPINLHDVKGFLQYVLERIDWSADLHFQTRTTIDTLDYSGDGWNTGSKLVIACNRDKSRELDSDLSKFHQLPHPFSRANLVQPGIVAIEGPGFSRYDQAAAELQILTDYLSQESFKNFPLIVLCDDARFVASDYNNFLWVCFTKSNPSHDLYGTGSGYAFKHWYCGHTLIIDARKKSHHAPELIVDSKTSKQVDEIIYRT